MEINEKILDLIRNAVIVESGDGDAIWLSKHTSLDEIIKLIEEYNLKNDTGWEIQKEENYLTWGINQEWATITNDELYFSLNSKKFIFSLNY